MLVPEEAFAVVDCADPDEPDALPKNEKQDLIDLVSTHELPPEEAVAEDPDPLTLTELLRQLLKRVSL